MPTTPQQPQRDSDIGNFAIIPEWLYEEGLPAGAIALFGLLGCYADRKKNTCWPSRRTLARRLDVAPASVDRWKKELERVGAIKIRAQTTESTGQTSNEYKLIYVAPPYSPVMRGATHQ